jgi:hypothetical protein
LFFCFVLYNLANLTNVFFHGCLVDQGNEYEPAPGVVTRRSEFNESLLWTHGNFVARPKRSGCFSFLPAPRTLFFFELLDRYDVDEVITCTPLGMYVSTSRRRRPPLLLQPSSSSPEVVAGEAGRGR